MKAQDLIEEKARIEERGEELIDRIHHFLNPQRKQNGKYPEETQESHERNSDEFAQILDRRAFLGMRIEILTHIESLEDDVP